MGKFEENLSKFNSNFDAIMRALENKNEIDKNDFEKSGIYALYITSYTNDYETRDRLVLPIYIGQTKNLFRRKNNI